MILLLFKIDNLKQLRIIDEVVVSDFEFKLNNAIDNLGVGYTRDVVGDSICYFLDTKGRDISNYDIVGVVLSLLDFLGEHEESFFGFGIAMLLVEGKKRNFVERLNRCIGRLEESNFILVDKRILHLFNSRQPEVLSNITLDSIDFVVFRGADIGFVKANAIGSNSLEKAKDLNIETRSIETTRGKEEAFPHAWPTVPHWVRWKEVERVVDAITPRLNWSNKEQIPYVFGFKGVGKTEIVMEALKTILGRDNAGEYIRLFVSIKSSSPLHPFINGIRGYLCRGKRVMDGEMLCGIEKSVWEEKSSLFYSIYSSSMNDVSPDFVLEDFMSLFHLYLLNYIRKMEKENLPAILVCDDIELYHPNSRKFLRFILRDFIELKSFIPIIVTSDRVILEEFEEFNIKKVYIPPLSWSSINELEQKITWGNSLSDREIKRLRRITGGLIASTLHCLLFFKSVEKSEWGNYDCHRVSFFLSWLLERFVDGEKEVVVDTLAGISLSYPFLLVEEQIEFIGSLGYPIPKVRLMISFLKNMGVVSVRDKIEPFISDVISAIERIDRERYKRVEDIFASYLLGMYREGKYSNFILLYYFFARVGQVEIARELYIKILDRKLTERDFRGVELFLQDKFVDSLRVTAVEKQILVGFYTTASLFLRGKYRKSYEVYRETAEKIAQIEKDSLFLETIRGKFDSLASRLKLSLEMVDDSLSMAKRVLMLFQHGGDPCGEIDIYNTIGFNMLSRGKTDEALDYFSMARNARCETPGIGKVESLVATGITSFVRGDLFKAKTSVEEAFSVAKGIYSREWEMFALFFIARIEFELGNYLKSVELMERLLAYDSVYRMSGAKTTFCSWLGRAFAYSGNPRIALRIFNSLSESGEETVASRFFTAEAHYFSFDYNSAIEELLELTNSISKYLGVYRFVPNQRIVWIDGFYNVEGRVKALSEAFLRRLTGSFLAYLYSLVGKYEDSIEFFREMIRGEKIPSYDPNLSLYYFLYSESLKNVRTHVVESWVVDDRFTVLNRAWKTLQERSNRISDFGYKKSYLEKNHWNSMIIERARENNLF